MKILLFFIACAYGMSVHAMNIYRKKIIEYSPSIIAETQLFLDSLTQTERTEFLKEIPAVVYDRVDAAIINPFDPVPQDIVVTMYLNERIRRLNRACEKIEAVIHDPSKDDDEQNLTEIQECIERLTSGERSSLFNIVDEKIKKELNEHRRRTMMDEWITKTLNKHNQSAISENKYENVHLKKANTLVKIKGLLEPNSTQLEDHSTKDYQSQL